MTDYRKLVVYFGLFMVSMMLWTAWQQEHQHPTTQQTVARQEQTNEVGQFVPSTQQTSQPVALQPAETKHTEAHQLIEVKTDVLHLQLDTQGGNIVRATLPAYPDSITKQHVPFTLLSDTDEKWYQAQSGVTGISQNGKPLTFHTTKKSYSLDDDIKALTVTLTAKAPNGVVVQKNYEFERGSYLVRLRVDIKNNSVKPWQGQVYTQLVKREENGKKHGFLGISSFTGASLSDPDNKRYEKISFKKMRKEPVDRKITGGWIAMQEHYFLSAWIPTANQTNRFYTNTSGKVFTIGMVSPKLNVLPGKMQSKEAKLYLGPEIMANLKKIAPGLDLTIDFGWLWPISIVLFQILQKIHSVVGNWGWAIVLLTVLIKLVFYKFSAISYHSMANMKKLQPRIEALKARYGEDKQKLGQATMALYKEAKVNPLGGCLPQLIQIPFFIALYWVLLESVELRQAPFILWIKDLAIPDPFYILPLIMGVSMYFQQKLNPPPTDPAQAKVFMFLPWVFAVLFANFPAGLVLYWVVNMLVSIAQQWYITSKIEA